MHLIDLLTPARVAAGVSVSSKKRLLELLANLLADGRGADVERTIYDSLCCREKLGSTALGQGVAIPHGRSAAMPVATAAFVLLKEPMDFGAPDGRPVDLLCALGVPEHFTNQHLMLLSQLAEMFGDESFCAELRAAREPAALYALLSDWRLTHAAA
ncbi:MAG: PTS sugar transporter subunit IIA [Xanthomonadales bacterium]|nr:PTS sugar transporter subunit IIA [Xanthomonadales bacterium]